MSCFPLAALFCALNVTPHHPPSGVWFGEAVMRATWYSTGTHTADGKRFNPNNPHIVAHKTLPFGTRLRITNPRNGHTLDAVVEDRGPFAKGKQLDLTLAGARQLGFVRQGVATLRVAVLP